ncbi:MAG: helix-turn-helix transcriptional regulator [Candidatus Heimdallarchaeota archaeon]|nr:MAG: helix-turn-helix transcriptional regulator [Candidatus Heimdallarchaeota archaeon]
MSRDPLNEIDLILKILSYQIENKNVLAMNEIDDILHLLANRTRRRMLAELALGEGFVNELVKRLDDHPQSIIRHLEVLKKHNLVVGKQRPGSGRGRPRLYYTLFPEVAELFRKPSQKVSELEGIHDCSSFPRLNTIKIRLNEKISHSEQRKIISEVESIKKEHEIALQVCNEILEKVKERVKKIEVK